MELKEYLKGIKKAAVAYSGGVDSSYLIYAAKKYGIEITAYYIKTQFQPEFEYKDAIRFADSAGVAMKIIEIDILKDKTIAENPDNRCYHCKRTILGVIKKAAAADGYDTLLEGTNASDDVSDRPGMRAVEELSVLSPLRDCSLTKDNIRELSKEAGLFTWDKPSYSCLATRVMDNAYITEEKLKKTESIESVLYDMGYCDHRARLYGDNVVLQFTNRDIKRAFSEYDKIRRNISPYSERISIDINER